MARINFCGFETGDFSEAGATTGSPTVQSTIKRTGGYAMLINANTEYATFRAVSATGTSNTGINLATVWIRFYLYVVSATSITYVCTFDDSSGNQKLALRINSDLTLSLHNSSNSAITLSGTPTISTNTWYLVEVKCTTGASAIAELKVNSTTYTGNASNLGTNNVDAVVLGTKTNSAGTIEYYIDDFSIDNADYPGAGEIALLTPNAAGTYSEWSAGAGAGDYTDLDDWANQQGDDADSTYLTTTSNNARLSTNVTSGLTGTINSVKPLIRARDVTNTVNFRIGLRSNTTDDYTTAADNNGSYETRCKIYNTDPATGSAWVLSALDSVQPIIQHQQSQARVLRCTAQGVSIDYTPEDNTVEADISLTNQHQLRSSVVITRRGVSSQTNAFVARPQASASYVNFANLSNASSLVARSSVNRPSFSLLLSRTGTTSQNSTTKVASSLLQSRFHQRNSAAQQHIEATKLQSRFHQQGISSISLLGASRNLVKTSLISSAGRNVLIDTLLLSINRLTAEATSSVQQSGEASLSSLTQLNSSANKTVGVVLGLSNEFLAQNSIAISLTGMTSLLNNFNISGTNVASLVGASTLQNFAKLVSFGSSALVSTGLLRSVTQINSPAVASRSAESKHLVTFLLNFSADKFTTITARLNNEFISQNVATASRAALANLLNNLGSSTVNISSLDATTNLYNLTQLLSVGTVTSPGRADASLASVFLLTALPTITGAALTSFFVDTSVINQPITLKTALSHLLVNTDLKTQLGALTADLALYIAFQQASLASVPRLSQCVILPSTEIVCSSNKLARGLSELCSDFQISSLTNKSANATTGLTGQHDLAAQALRIIESYAQSNDEFSLLAASSRARLASSIFETPSTLVPLLIISRNGTISFTNNIDLNAIGIRSLSSDSDILSVFLAKLIAETTGQSVNIVEATTHIRRVIEKGLELNRVLAVTFTQAD